MRIRLSLTCRACEYRELDLTTEQALSRRERHRSAFGDAHDVTFETVEDCPLFRGGVSDDWE